MLPEEGTSRREDHKKTLQNNMESGATLNLQYTDTVLTLRRFVPHCMLVLSIRSAFHFITETQALSSIYVTFGTLFHQSLMYPTRPLKQQQTHSLCGDHSPHMGCAKKDRSNKLDPRLVIQGSKQQEDSLKNSHISLATRYYRGRKSRRFSITAPSQLPVAPADRRLSRRYSIGLASPDKFSSDAFPATLMYAKIVSHLETNLESARHYYHFQRFSNCFCGQSMVNCLMSYCVASLQMCISKEKATELCKRLLNHGVIENVSHKKQQETEGIVFKCSRLYRFTGNHFWEEVISPEPEMDGGTRTTNHDTTSLSSTKKMTRQLKLRMTFSEKKTGFMRSCRTRFSMKTRGSNTI